MITPKQKAARLMKTGKQGLLPPSLHTKAAFSETKSRTKEDVGTQKTGPLNEEMRKSKHYKKQTGYSSPRLR